MVTGLIFSSSLQVELCFTLPFITAYCECE